MVTQHNLLENWIRHRPMDGVLI